LHQRKFSTDQKHGNGEFYGVHDKAPFHEFYIAVFPGDFYGPIHRHGHEGFNYLWPGTPKEEFQVNFLEEIYV